MLTPHGASLSFAQLWAIADRLRAEGYRLAAPWFKRLYSAREQRVLVLGCASVLVSLALTVAVPLWLLAVGPIVLGVPHLLGDVRYLVVKPGLHRRKATWLVAVPLLLMATGAPAVVGVSAATVAVLFARGAWWRKGLVFVATLALALWAVEDEWAFSLVFLHAHNLIALAMWAALRRGRRSTTVAVTALTVCGAALLLAGLADPLTTWLGGWQGPTTATGLDDFVASNAPFDDVTLGTHALLSFAFLQSVHYGVWVRLVPDDLRERPAPQPFRASWQALERDFGRWPLVSTAFVAVVLAGWAVVNLGEARLGYLRVAGFHGYLELAVIGWWLVEGRRVT